MTAYLDNAATTKPFPEVVARVAEVSSECYGNASSPHVFGRRSRRIIDESRAIIAESFGVLPEEIYFTSGGTEANNLATRGSVMALAAKSKTPPRVITSELEHPSVTRSIRELKRGGHPVAYVPAVRGDFDIEAFRTALGSDVALISLMWIQNVFGYRFPIEEAARLRDELAPQALLHSDAVQAYGYYDLKPAIVGVDLLSVSAHKIGGPKGIGALYVRKGTKLFTTVFGGGQEGGLRSGTEAVPLIAGFATAVQLMMDVGNGSTVGEGVAGSRDGVAGKTPMYSLQADPEFGIQAVNRHFPGPGVVWQHLEDGLKARFPEVVINSRSDGSPAILHFSLPGLNNKDVVEFLGEREIYVGLSTACDTSHVRPNEEVTKKHPLVARLAGLSACEESGSFRASFGVDTTTRDIDALLEALVQYKLRSS